MTKKMKNIWDMTNMILWKWDSMILWSMSINPIIFGVHSPWQYHSIAEAGVWLCLLPWALQDTTVEAILNRWRKRSVCLCSPALPVPLMCWQSHAEMMSQHSWLLSLGSAGGRGTMGAAADLRDCSGAVQEPPWMVSPTSQPSLPEHLQSPLSPHCLVQRFLHSTVIFCAESQSSPLSLLYPNITSTVLMLSVCLSLNIFLFMHE